MVSQQNNAEVKPNDVHVKPDEQQVIDFIRGRIKAELVGKFGIDKRIAVPRKPGGKRDGLTIVPGAATEFDPRTRRIRYLERLHMFTDKDADNLAAHYKGWVYTGADERIRARLAAVMNADEFKMAKAMDFNLKREKTNDETFDKAQDEVDNLMKNVKFATADIVNGELNYEDRLPVGTLFHVRLPGASDKTYSGDNASAFLGKLGIM